MSVIFMQLMDAVTSVLTQGGIAVTASWIRHMWEFGKGSKFRFVMFIVHGLAGLLVGNILYNIIPPTVTYKVSLMWIIGFLSYPLLHALDSRGVFYIEAWAKKVTGLDVVEEGSREYNERNERRRD